jgi:hypothetical protein
MPLTDTHVPTRTEVEEAIAHHRGAAKAAFDAGNLPAWDRMHGRINELLDEWRWVCEFVG